MYNYVHRFSHPVPTVPVWTTSAVELNQTLRRLWLDHIYWTRLTVNSIVGRLPDEAETSARLLRNPSDFADVLRPLYGPAIAAGFESLLRSHLTIAAELVTALRDGNQAAAADAQRRWYENADAIADFLGRINPYWSSQEWQKMMREHLRLLTLEVSSRIAGNYKENVALNDQVEPQALMMADVMTNGVLRQFPQAFAR